MRALALLGALVVTIAVGVPTIATSQGTAAHSAEQTPVISADRAASGPTYVPVTACSPAVDGTTAGAPAITSAMGLGGTTTDDLESFAHAYNDIRVAQCLEPFPLSRFFYDSCMEQRLFWMAEDPSTDPTSAWGHIGTVRSDGLPSLGCDGNLAGGTHNSGATVATKWWDSLKHRASLYRPDDDIKGACIGFAMTHGGIPDEPDYFNRAAARWTTCPAP